MKSLMKKILLLSVSALALTAMLSGCGNSSSNADAKKKQYKIGVVQLVEHAALDAANKGILDGLASKGYKVDENITIDQQNAQNDQANLKNIADRFVSNKDDLIFAIATPAAQTVANTTKTIPIVGTAITDYVEAKLVNSNEAPKTNVTGTTDMNPVKEQIDLLLQIVPTTKTIGIIYSSSEVNSQLQAEIAKEHAKSKNIEIKEVTISNVNDIQQVAQSLVGKVDSIYIPTDNMLASAMPTLISITKPAKIPVICGESNMVVAGGIATKGIDYYQLGFQTGEMAADILSGKSKPENMPIQSQKDFKIVINQKEAAELGLTIPEDLLKIAEIIDK